MLRCCPQVPHDEVQQRDEIPTIQGREESAESEKVRDSDSGKNSIERK